MGDIPISVLYCRTLSDGVGAEETDGVTMEEGGGGRDEGGLVHTSPETLARLQYGEDIQS